MRLNKTSLCLLLLVILLAVAVVTLSVLYAVRPQCPAAAPGCPVAVESTTLDPRLVTTERQEAEDDTDDGTQPWKRPRLPSTVRPSTYDLFLHPDLHAGTFGGHVTIVVRVLADTDCLIVHCDDALNVSDVVVATGDGRRVEARDRFRVPGRHYLVLPLAETLKADESGNYTLYFEFDGSLLENSGFGFYTRSYADSVTGNNSYFAVTKFQPTFARNAFPCFDEPSFKSIFKIRVRHDRNFHAVSNMPEEQSTTLSNSWTDTTFVPSPPMVTYLVCILVSDFKYLRTTTIDNKEFRVYARPDQLKHGSFALEFGAKVHSIYEKYFQIPYSLPKQDMIAVPDYLDAGMEHWGLIAYNENHLLLDERSADTQNWRSTATIIAHELTHQWFGNLVTMEWWDDLWLNEGFATYFSYYGVSHAKPEWNVKASSIWTILSSLPLDDIATTHPIVQPVKTSDEIHLLFDEISYHKGAAMIRMMEGFLRPERFRKGIKMFLQAHAFGSATTLDLWRSLSEASNMNISDVMDTWILQKGYPVIEIRRNGNSFTAIQYPFLHNSSFKYNKSEAPFGYLWKVPLTYRTATMTEPTLLWMNTTEEISFVIPNLNSNQWVKFNHDTTGYYRVNYGIDQWEMIVTVLQRNLTSFSTEDRTGMLDDAFSLAEADLLPYSIPLKVLMYLRKEKAYEPWVIATGYIDKLDKLLMETTDYALFREKLIDIIEPIMDRVGWTDNGSLSVRKLRVMLMSTLCDLQHSACLKKASDMFSNWLDRKKFAVPTNFDILTLKHGVANSGVEEWNEVWSRYLEESSPQKKRRLVAALACTRIPWLMQRLIEVATTSDSVVAQQDTYLVLKNLKDNPVGKYVLWNYVRSHWKDPYRFTRGLTKNSLGMALEMIISNFNSEVQLNEVKHFLDLFSDEMVPKRNKVKTINKIEKNIAWLQKHQIEIHKWLTT